MLYGYCDGLKTVVTAGKSVVEFEGWYQKILEGDDAFYKSQKATDFMDHMTNPDFKGYRHPAYIFEHNSEGEQSAFVDKHNVLILPPFQAKDFMLDMMAEVEESLRNEFNLRTPQTIGELAGIEENDPWDPRSESEIEAAKKQEKVSDELRKRLGDHVTGQSFDPNPRSGVEDGMKITDIFNSGGKINVSARKFGSGSKAANPLSAAAKKLSEQLTGAVTQDMFDRAERQFTEVGYSSEEIEKIKEQFDFANEEHQKAYVDLAHSEAKRLKLGKALSPVEGDMTHDEIKSEVEKRLREIEELTDEERGEIMKGVDVKLNTPTPKPADYRFALNQRLTDEPAMRGEGTPIFSFAKNPFGPNGGKFGTGDLPLLLPKSTGFDLVSGEIYEYTGGTADEGRDWLIQRGFVEDHTVVPTNVQKKSAGDGRPLPTPEDFAKALAGNGTSCASVTDSWGRKVVGMESNPEVDVIKPGIVGNKGAVQPMLDGMVETAFDDLPASLKSAIGVDLEALNKAGKTIKMGDYVGMGMAGGTLFPLIETPDYKIRDDLSGNVKDYGGVELGGSTTRIMSRDNARMYGVVVYEGKDEVLIVKF